VTGNIEEPFDGLVEICNDTDNPKIGIESPWNAIKKLWNSIKMLWNGING